MWQVTDDLRASSNMIRFRDLANQRYGLNIDSYRDLHAWSIHQPRQFWDLCQEFVGLRWIEPFTAVLDDSSGTMIDCKWYVGGRLNYAEHLLRRSLSLDTAIIARRESESASRYLSGAELWQQVAACAAHLRGAGIEPGDRVCAVVENSIEAVVASLATIACGGVWSSCSPDFGVRGIVDRFSQIEPVFLFYTPVYQYAGRACDIQDVLVKACAQLPTLKARYSTSEIVLASGGISDFARDEWTLTTTPRELIFTPMASADPLFIMFSSGTTGKPKCIIHGVAGTLVQHLKELVIHADIRPGDTLGFYTTCGWMMWNWMLSVLGAGARLALYDGSVQHPHVDELWRFADEAQVTHFGTSPKYLSFCMKSDIKPRTELRPLLRLRQVLTTGAPLMPEHYDWVYQQLSPVHLASISGGTDIISCFALGNLMQAVHRGEIQGAGLGMSIASFDEAGVHRDDLPGELVCTRPFVSMPLGFYNDPRREAYRSAYFAHYPGVWRHGDMITMKHDTGGIVIHGRSDTTLNPGGVRIGTAELYRCVESLDDVLDSIAAPFRLNGDEHVVLFIKVRSHALVQTKTIPEIIQACRSELTPRHVPWRIFAVDDVPYTKSGKKVEVAVAAIINGSLSRGEVANPECLEQYRMIASQHLNAERTS